MPIHKNFIAKSIAVVFLIAALAVVRKLENMLFYDPFLSFFHLNNANAVFPDFNTMQLLCSYAGRYLLNTIISLLILYVVFKSTSAFRRFFV